MAISPPTAVEERRDAPPVHVCIRQTLNWADPSLVNAHIIPSFRPKFEVWNDTLSMPYHVFRHHVKTIALLNFSRIEGALQSRIDEVPPGHVIVPVDDDDWFAPDLVTWIRQTHVPGASGYLWRRETLEQKSPIAGIRDRIGRLVGRREKFTCKTNNYAVLNEPELAPLALNHVRASAYFDAHSAAVKQIPATLGIQNRTLASQTTLAWGRSSIGREELAVLLERHRALYRSWRPTADLRWAGPYIELMNELMAQIHLK